MRSLVQFGSSDVATDLDSLYLWNSMLDDHPPRSQNAALSPVTDRLDGREVTLRLFHIAPHSHTFCMLCPRYTGPTVLTRKPTGANVSNRPRCVDYLCRLALQSVGRFELSIPVGSDVGRRQRTRSQLRTALDPLFLRTRQSVHNCPLALMAASRATL